MGLYHHLSSIIIYNLLLIFYKNRGIDGDILYKFIETNITNKEKK
jgi:hypothetical protein